MSLSRLVVSLFVTLLCVSGVVGSIVWPRVAHSNFGERELSVSPELEFSTQGEMIKTLSLAYERYKGLIFTHATPSGASGVISAVLVNVKDASEGYPQLETDESYELSISSDGEVALTATTIYGALRGLESFSQLVLFDYDKEEYYISQIPLTIQDSPRYAHRGMLLDTSRHFQPIAEIQRTIDALSYAKYNG